MDDWVNTACESDMGECLSCPVSYQKSILVSHYRDYTSFPLTAEFSCKQIKIKFTFSVTHQNSNCCLQPLASSVLLHSFCLHPAMFVDMLPPPTVNEWNDMKTNTFAHVHELNKMGTFS